jgi:fatty-acyl-CoA synthase
MPDGFVFVQQIPRTSVGKFQKSRLRQMFVGWRQEQALGGSSG